MSNEKSVTQMIAKLKDGDEQAAQAIWEGFFHRVCGLANKKLGAASKRAHDEEDIALSAINALCTGAKEGKFRQLENRDDLWQLLCMLTSRKAALAWRKQQNKKEVGESIIGFGTEEERMTLDQFVQGAPDQNYLDSLTATSSELMAGLDERLRQVALLKLRGFSNQEIADQLQRSVKSVERYLQTIRKKWNDQSEAAD